MKIQDTFEYDLDKLTDTIDKMIDAFCEKWNESKSAVLLRIKWDIEDEDYKDMPN